MKTRTVHPPAMVAYLWANKAQDYGRNPGNSLWFRGNVIYSYGLHFPIARHIARNGRSAVLLSTRGYSKTTESHKRLTEDACRHLTVFHVVDVVDFDVWLEFTGYRAKYKALIGKYARARQRKPEYLWALRRLTQEANEYAIFFGLRARICLPDNLEAMIAECRAIEKRERERKQRKREAARE